MKHASIFDLPQLVDSFSPRLRKKFASIYSYDTQDVPLLYASQQEKVTLAKRFHVPTTFLDTRHTLSITNMLFSQQTCFNPLRHQRPNQLTSDAKHLQKDIEKTQESCTFCDTLHKTPADPFGRVENTTSITAGNIGAYAGLNSLVISKHIHNPFELTEDVFTDMISLAHTWFQKAHAYYPNLIYPLILWNRLPQSGASFYHPHLQVLLSSTPFTKLAHINESIATYETTQYSSFLATFCEVAEALTLMTPLNHCYITPSLTPLKENEIILFPRKTGQYITKELSHTVFRLLSVWQKNAYNLCYYLPPLDQENSSWNQFLPMIRIIQRGSEETTNNDMGAMDMFAASVVSSDPFVLSNEITQVFTA